MKPRRLKKGFTLVELLVVIAILAVLAGVSVIGYLSFTGQAKESADQQAVTQMNIALEAQEAVDAPDDVEEAKTVLKDAGFAVDDYVPLEKQNIFYYDQQSNRVLIFDQEESKVTFPQEMADKYSLTSEKVGYWYLLNDKTYEWVPFTSSSTSDVPTISTEFVGAVRGLGDTELLRLSSDITINNSIFDPANVPNYTFPVNEANDVHIDLNGHTLNMNTFTYLTGLEGRSYTAGSFTFSNGKIVIENPNGAFNKLENANFGFSVNTSSNLTLNNCDLVFNAKDLSGKDYNILSASSYAKITLSNCTVSCDDSAVTAIFLMGKESETNIFNSDINCNFYGLSTNAGKNMSSDVKVKVQGSTISSSGGPGILLNVPGTYRFSESTLEGHGQAAMFRGGDAVIENSVIKETGDSTQYLQDNNLPAEFSQAVSSSTYANGKWGNGNNVQHAGLVVGDWADAYAYDATCELINTEVHMNDTLAELPIVYLSQDNGFTTNLKYDSSCKFFKGETEFSATDAVMTNTKNGSEGAVLKAGIIKINDQVVPAASGN